MASCCLVWVGAVLAEGAPLPTDPTTYVALARAALDGPHGCWRAEGRAEWRTSGTVAGGEGVAEFSAVLDDGVWTEGVLEYEHLDVHVRGIPVHAPPIRQFRFFVGRDLVQPSAELEGLRSWRTTHHEKIVSRTRPPVELAWVEAEAGHFEVRWTTSLPATRREMEELNWTALFSDDHVLSSVRLEALPDEGGAPTVLHEVAFRPTGEPLEEWERGPGVASHVQFSSFRECTGTERALDRTLPPGVTFPDLELHVEEGDSLHRIVARTKSLAEADRYRNEGRLHRTLGLTLILGSGLTGAAAALSERDTFSQGLYAGQALTMGLIGSGQLMLAASSFARAKRTGDIVPSAPLEPPIDEDP